MATNTTTQTITTKNEEEEEEEEEEDGEEENIWEEFNNNQNAIWADTPAGLKLKISHIERELAQEDVKDKGKEALILRLRFMMAWHLRDAREFQAADHEFHALLEIHQQLNGKFHDDTIEVVKELASLLVWPGYQKVGQWEEADALVRGYRAELDAVNADADEGAELWPDARIDLDVAVGHVLVKTTMFDPRYKEIPSRVPVLAEAAPILEAALDGLKDRWHLGKDTLDVMANLSVAYRRLGRLDDAADMEEDVLKRHREKYLNRNVPFVATQICSCAAFAASARRYERSVALFRECLALLEATRSFHKASDRDLADVVVYLGRLLEHLGREEEARELGIKYWDRLRKGNHVALGCVPSFQPEKALWLPK